MPSHFQWLLNCPDNNTGFTLTSDPVNWADCVYTLQRHPVYRGIFHQFTSMLKFHPDGGGKQFIDGIYQQYDIDGNIYITINIDSTGMGDYVLLFQGKLNLASYTTDGTFTSVNIDPSDLLVKLNTRANIPVALNVPVVPAGYYNTNGQWVIYSFKGIILDTYDNSNGNDGVYAFSDPLIVEGFTYIAQTLDTNQNPLTASVVYNGLNNPNNGTQSETEAGINLSIAVVSAQVQITFSGLANPVILYQVGNQQTSMGQQPISSVFTDTLTLPGIPVQYESEFVMIGEANSGTVNFSQSPEYDWPTGEDLTAGFPLYAATSDLHGNIVFDQLVIGQQSSGPGTTSTDGLTKIQILSYNTLDNTVSVAFTNASGYIDLYLGSVGGGGSQENTDIGGLPLATYTPTNNGTSQQFAIPSQMSGNTLGQGTGAFGGNICFDATTLFDNLDDFVFASFNNIANNTEGNAPSSTSDSIPPICSGITGAYTQYPVQVNYSIKLSGTLSDYASAVGVNRDYYLKFILAYGGGTATGNTSPLSVATSVLLVETGLNVSNQAQQSGYNTFNINASGTFELNPGDQIWLYGYVLGGVDGGFANGTTLAFTLNFETSDIDFKVLSIAPSTTAETVLVHEAFNQVVDAIADTDGNFYSQFYGRTNSQKQTYPANGPGSLRALTNGLCIRGYTSKYISMSLTDIFTAMAAIDNIGLTVNANNQVQVEQLSFFFDPSNEIIVLPNVNAYTQTNENSLYLNQVEVGYDKFETELYFKNGLDEIHATRNYGTRIGAAKGTILENWNRNTSGYLKIANKLNAVSAFIAGNYTIELTRRKNLAFSNDDFKYDNDNFILCLASSINAPLLYCDSSEGNSPFPNQFGLGIGFNPGFQIGDSFTISGTKYNNGTYIITGLYLGGNFLLIGVANTLIYESTVPSPTVTITDNTRYMLEFASTVLQQLPTGVYDPVLTGQWLNMSITPARLLQNHANEITAGMQIINGKIQFITGTGNYLAASQMYATGLQQDYSGKLLSESASLQWNDANVENITPLWGTQIFKFDYPLTYQQFQTILQNPNGYITFFKFANYPMYGFIMSMEYNLKTGMTSFELLQMYGAPTTLDTESGGGLGFQGGNQGSIQP